MKIKTINPTENGYMEKIRSRLAALPPELLERLDHALKHESIQQARTLLFHAGEYFASAELHEYRKTLFPPNSMLDPHTAGPPVLRETSEPFGVPPLGAPGASPFGVPPLGGPGASLSQEPPPPVQEPPPAVGRDSVEPPSPPPAAPESSSTQLHELRQRLLQLLAARAKQSNHEPQTSDIGPLISDIRPPISDVRPPPSGSSLLTALRDMITRFVVLPDMAAETLALWVVHTYAFTLRQVTTYISVVSPEKRCGKTTLLELLGLLANRSLTAANISPSALFRVIQETRPTLLIDEADTFLQGRDELAGILNAGYRKSNSYVVRVAEGKARRKPGGTSYTSPQFAQWSTDLPQDPSIHDPSIDQSTVCSPAFRRSSEFAQYSCWCPKVMAAIGRLPDTLADRCIVITMQRKMPGEKCERLRHLDATEYRKRCAEFVRQHSEAIANARPEIPSSLNDRAADIWEPLLGIADLAGGEWPQIARQAALKLSSYDDELTLVGYFLKDLRNWMVLSKVDRMLSRDIVATFNRMHDRPWEDLRRGREINEWWLGHKMSELGIRSRPIRLGELVAKGYMFTDIDAAFRRYVPNPDIHSAQPPSSEISNVKS